MRNLVNKIREVRAADRQWCVTYGPFLNGLPANDPDLDKADDRVRAALAALPRPIRWIWS